MNNFKAQGLSMTTIVLAALALLVLVILILIFTGRMSLFSKGAEDSTNCNQFCKSMGLYSEGKDYSQTDITLKCGPENDKEYKKVNFGNKLCSCCKKI